MAGYGFGPLSTLTVSQSAAAPVTLPAGGRSLDQNGIMDGRTKLNPVARR